MDSSVWIARGVVVGSGAIVLLLALAALVFQQGARRAALVAGLVPAALVAPAVALSLAAFAFIRVFAGLAAGAGNDGLSAIVRLEAEGVWGTARVGFGLAALAGLLGLAGGLLRFGAGRDGAPACSARRGLVLLLLPLTAVLAAGLQARQLWKSVAVAQAVVAETGGDATRQAAVGDFMAAQGLGTTGSGSIAETAQFVAAGATGASLGGVLLVVILLGLATCGTLLAWPVRVGPVFVAASSGLWLLLCGVGAAAALGWGAPPAF